MKRLTATFTVLDEYTETTLMNALGTLLDDNPDGIEIVATHAGPEIIQRATAFRLYEATMAALSHLRITSRAGGRASTEALDAGRALLNEIAVSLGVPPATGEFGTMVVRDAIAATLGPCTWPTLEECRAVRERIVAGTDRPVPACPEHGIVPAGMAW